MTRLPHFFTLSLIAAAALALTACGGGGTSADSTAAGATATETPSAGATAALFTPVTTTVMDGLIRNALVCVDSNDDGICQTTETQGRTNAVGQVTLDVPTARLAATKLVAQVGADATDADTGLVKTPYSMQTPAGKLNVISPLTTLVQTKIDSDKAVGINTSIEAAEAHLKAQIGLTTASVFDDYEDEIKTSDSSEHKKAKTFASATVLSVQKSKEREAEAAAAGTPSTCTTSAYSGSNGNDDNESENENDDNGERDEHTQENHIERNLLDSLDAIRNYAESDHEGLDSDDLKNLVPYVSPCTSTTGGTTGTTTPPVTTPPVTSTPTASAIAGKASYMSLCASCHTATPANNVSKILRGANSASTILNAVSSNKGGMGYLSGSVNATVASDMAAYLATPGI